MGKINSVSSKKFTWVDINHPSLSDLKFLKTKHKFLEKDILDSLPSKHAQRPHVSLRNHYIFIAGLFPIYNTRTRSITSAEVDVFISKDHLFTIHDQKISILTKFFNKLSTDENERTAHLSVKPSFLFYEILDRLYHEIFPMLDHLNKDIKNVEKKIFAGREKEMIKEILVIKNKILNFKRIMQAHRSMIKKLLRTENSLIAKGQFIQLYYTELLDHVKDIWTILETYEDSISSLESTNNALVEFNMNQVITTLTILTVLIFPFSLLGGIFGMNAKHMPIIGQPYDFWLIIALMFGLTILMYVIFKKKGWI